MAATERLATLITANGSQAISEFQRTGAAASKSLDTIDDSRARLSRNLVAVGAGMAAVGAVMLAGLYRAAQAAQEEDRAILSLNNAMQNSPELAGASADAFLDQAAALQDTTVYSDDATIAMQALLASSHLTQDEILQLTPLVQDLASKMGMDLSRAGTLVAKAMAGNIGALRRMNVNIDESAFASDRLGAVMDALRQKAGGFAEQEGQTFNGQIQILKNNMGDLAEGVGRGAVEAFNRLLGPVQAISDAFENLSPGVQGVVGKFAAFGAAGLIAVGTASMITGWLMKLRAAYVALTPGVQAATLAQGGFVASIAGPAALAAAVAGLALYANSLSDFTLNIQDAAGATEDELQRVAVILAYTFPEEIDTTLADMFAVDADSARILGDQLIALGVPAEDVKAGLDDGAVAATEAAGGLDEAARSAEELESAMGLLNQEITDYLNLTQSTQEAAASEAEAQQALFDALTQNGHTFNVNTEAGRENIRVMNSWVDTVAAQVQAASDYAAATGNAGVAQRRANQAIQSGIGDLRAMRDAGLITQEQFVRLRNQMLRIPHEIDSTVDADTGPAMTKLEAAKIKAEEWANSTYTSTINADVNIPGWQWGGNAHGGFIREGESTNVHAGETVSVHGGVAKVTPAVSVNDGPGTVELSDRSIRKLARELAMMGSPNVNVSVGV
jgi:hypothetical protein